MPTPSEKTFGQRYAKGRNLAVHIGSVTDYAPSNGSLKVSELNALLDNINTVNNSIATSSDLLKQTRQVRMESFHGTNGIKERSRQVRDYLASLENGKNSVAYKSVQKEVQKMISYRKPRKETAPDGTQETMQTHSQSETSFGSLLQHCKNVVAIIQNMDTAYQPDNASIKTAELLSFIQDIETCNNKVQTHLSTTNTLIADRQKLYDGANGLRERMAAVKNYLSGKYGKSSQVYKEALKIKY